jgi:hypothetical protein
VLPVVDEQLRRVALGDLHSSDVGRVAGDQPKGVHPICFGTQVDISAKPIVDLELVVRVIPVVAHLSRSPVVDEGVSDGDRILSDAWDAIGPVLIGEHTATWIEVSKLPWRAELFDSANKS